MTPEDVSKLTISELHKSASQAVRFAFNINKTDEWVLSGIMDGEFRPTANNTHALMVAAALDMNINFGDKVVLVSEPAGLLSRSVRYAANNINFRMDAARRAITLLAADYAQYL